MRPLRDMIFRQRFLRKALERNTEYGACLQPYLSFSKVSDLIYGSPGKQLKVCCSKGNIQENIVQVHE